MSAQNNAGSWIPLIEYSVKNGVSLSTLRRYIKANRIQYRKENGRYLLWDAEPVSSDFVSDDKLQKKVNRLEGDLQKAQEEIDELRMLVALYEEKLSPRMER